jgi:hypothetical protein
MQNVWSDNTTESLRQKKLLAPWVSRLEYM